MIRQQWVDERLDFTDLNLTLNKPITFDGSIVEELWIPDLIFLGTTSEKRHQVVRSNDMLRVSSNGEILLCTGQIK